MRNPYLVDRALTDQDLYTGREAAFKRVGAWLEAGKRLLFVCGRPAIGKTSFLNQLDVHLSAGYAPVTLEVGTAPTEADDPLWWLLVRLAEALKHAAPDQRIYQVQGGEYVARYLREVVPTADAPMPVVCLDALPVDILEGDARWLEALAALRAALDDANALVLVLAIAGLPTKLSEALPGVPALLLGSLTEDESDRLLTVSVRGSMTYDYEAVRLIHQMSGGDPYFVQLFGWVLFERRSTAGWVGLPEVRNALDEVLALGAARFEETWAGCAPRERIVLGAFAEMMGRHGVAAPGDIATHLRHKRVHVPVEDIGAALVMLTHQGMVEELGGKVYRMSSELLRLWLGRNHSVLEAVRQSRRYRQLHEEPSGGLRDKRIDWMGVLLWVVAAALVVVIAWVWRAREGQLVIDNTTPSPDVVSTTVAGVPTRALPTPESGVAPGSIVYMARETEEDAWDLYVMRSDGSDPTRLTTSPSNETMPVWSPDGRKLAFVSDRDGNREVYVMNADGSSQINLTANTADDWTPCWSPDGQRIAFASFRDGNWELYVMNADGSDPKRLTTHSAADYSPAWSPDGRTIAFVSSRDGNLEIYLFAVDGGQATRLTDDGATDQAPAWSPDGKTLVWESYRDSNMEIYAADADGANPRNLGRDSYADDHGPTISPWGGRIAYYANRHGGWDIYTLDLETGERINLTASPAFEQAPNWGP